mgnify:CR=1 FL=1
MKKHSQWGGPGRCYDFIDPGDSMITANQYGRQGTQAKDSFRFKTRDIFASGASNSGDSKSSQEMSGQGSFVTAKPGDTMGSA